MVEGPIRTSSYTDENNEKRSVKLLNVLNVQFGTKPRVQGTSAKDSNEQTKTQETEVKEEPAEEELDLPF